MTRRESRVTCMQILYSCELSEISLEDALKNINQDKISEDVKSFINLVCEHKSAIDEVIINSLVNYSFNRLNLVDKEIIRIATAEMMYTDTPKQVVIDEAIEITKAFSDCGDRKAVAFNNKLLDNISKNIQ